MILDALLSAWFLTWFSIDDMLIEVFQPFTDVKLTSSHYYVTFFFVGVVLAILKYYKG